MLWDVFVFGAAQQQQLPHAISNKTFCSPYSNHLRAAAHHQPIESDFACKARNTHKQTHRT